MSDFQKLSSDAYTKTGTAKIFAENRFNNNIRAYCDTCKYALVALVGMNEIIDLRKDYAEHKDFYQSRNRIRISGWRIRMVCFPEFAHEISSEGIPETDPGNRHHALSSEQGD